MDAILEQLLAQRRLINQAARLRLDLRKAGREPGVYGSERYTRIQDIIRRHDDRIDRRQWTSGRISSGKSIVRTAQVAKCVRDNIANYRVVGGAAPVEVAGDVTNALDLWDEHGSIPQWVHGVCEREVARDRRITALRRNFFVEKVVNYTETGDVLWA